MARSLARWTNLDRDAGRADRPDRAIASTHACDPRQCRDAPRRSAQQSSARVADALLHLVGVVLLALLPALSLRLRRVARLFALDAPLLPRLLQLIRLRLLGLSHGQHSYRQMRHPRTLSRP